MKGKSVAVVLLLFLFIQGNSSPLHPPDPMTAKQLLENIKKREFTGEVMDFNFNNVDLNQIFQRFETISGFKFEVDSEINIVRKFSFKGLEWDKVLYLILLNLELELQLDNGVFRVIEARPQSSRFSIYFLAGIVFTVLFVVLAFIFIRQAKKRIKIRQIDKKYPLPEDRVEEIRKSLDYLFEVEKIYRDELLSLNSLAEKLDIPSHQLSWIINYKIGKSFFDFLNRYRVEEVKKRLTDSRDRNSTILEIAYSSGFRTKSAFNKTFKILTGKTPRDYRVSNNYKAS
jgi:AraC-like DNA-binding protein